jgi:hypothetical protein
MSSPLRDRLARLVMSDSRMKDERRAERLEDEARKEDERIVRERLREELGHEPSTDEVDRWIREHTGSV